MLKFRLAIILLVAELWFCIPKVECDGNFTQCYNTATEMHCFSKIVNGAHNFSEAQKLCSAIDAALPVIKDDEVQTMLETFISTLRNSAGIEDGIFYFWTNASRIIETKWHWLNSSVISDLNVSITNIDFHVASLARQDSDQQEVLLTVNHPGEEMRYICEFFDDYNLGSDCFRQNGNVLQYGDKCYVASTENTTWYDARNRCLKQRGDLASFGDLKNTNINFTQWLDLSTGMQYWVGVRFLWWLWKNSNNTEVRYTNWFRRYPLSLYSGDECMIVYANSGVPSQINGWKPLDCNQDQSVGVICHKVTSLDSLKDTTIYTVKSSATTSTVVTSSDSSKDTTLYTLISSTTASTVVSPIDSSKDTTLYTLISPTTASTVVTSFDSSKASTVNTLNSSTTASTVITSSDSSNDTTTSNCSGCPNALQSSITSSSVIPLAVGIGLGLGIPVVIALIVIIIVCVRRKRKPRPRGINSYDFVLNDAPTDPTQTDTDDVTTEAKYWEVARNDSASVTSEVNQVIDSPASDTNGGHNIVYSNLEIVEGQDQDNLN